MPLRIVDTSYIKRSWLDVAYAAESPTQKLDIYLPKRGKGPFPVIVSIHGGAFKKGDKRDNQVLPMLAGVERGYAVVSVNYRLSGEAVFPANLYDVKAAVRFLRAHAAEYCLDSAHIAAWGGSAGGNLSALLGLSADRELVEDVVTVGESCAVQAVVDWFGPTEFSRMDEQLRIAGFDTTTHSAADSPESLVLGEKLSEIPELVRAASPLTYVSKDAPPFLIQHGDRDAIVPMGQSWLLYEALHSVVPAGQVTFELLQGASHGDAMFETARNVERVFAFLDPYLKK